MKTPTMASHERQSTEWYKRWRQNCDSSFNNVSGYYSIFFRRRNSIAQRRVVLCVEFHVNTVCGEWAKSFIVYHGVACFGRCSKTVCVNKIEDVCFSLKTNSIFTWNNSGFGVTSLTIKLKLSQIEMRIDISQYQRLPQISNLFSETFRKHLDWKSSADLWKLN